MKKFSAVQLFAVLLAASAITVHAQPSLDPMSGGTKYIVAFPDTTRNTYDNRFAHQSFSDALTMMIYSPVDTKVDVTSNGDGTMKSYQLQAGKFTLVQLMGSQGFANPIVTEHNQVVNNTFTVESQSPVILYCYMLTGFGCEAWMPLPTEWWGIKYFAAAYPGEVGRDESPGGSNNLVIKNRACPSEILIIAAYDNTQVSIQPNGMLAEFASVTVTLNAGQAYLVQCQVDTLLAHVGNPNYESDLGGTNITANHPIGVISGNTRAQLYAELPGLTGNSVKNMLIEWITPVELHGKEFVYMPSWDPRKPTGASKEDVNGKRLSEYVRVYSTFDDQTSVYRTDGVSGMTDTLMTDVHPSGEFGWFLHDRISVFLAQQYRTAKPSQAFMASAGASKNLAVSGGVSSGNLAEYHLWGGYMTEMVPRERWASFAPYYAPSQPDTMEHFINVVTDTAHRFSIYQENGSYFIFNRGTIPGTDLCWGTMTVTPGVTHYLEGRNGARFSGFVYGSAKGYEIVTLATTRKKDGGATVSSNGSTPLNPGQAPLGYIEQIGASYGYPLSPQLRVVLPTDSFNIETEQDCDCMTARVAPAGSNSVGLKTITLDQDTSLTKNAFIRFYKDSSSVEIPPTDILGATKAFVKVCAINPLQDAKAVMVVKDRTGKTSRVTYTYKADKFTATPSGGINFSYSGQNVAKDTTIEITNANAVNTRLQAVQLAVGSNYSITGTEPTLPYIFVPGQKLIIHLRFLPTQILSYRDTLQVIQDCATMKFLLTGSGISGVHDRETIGLGGVLVTPNPATGIATVRYTLGSRRNIVVSVFDALGRSIYRANAGVQNAGEQRVILDTAPFAEGSYTVVIGDDSGGTVGIGRVSVVR